MPFMAFLAVPLIFQILAFNCLETHLQNWTLYLAPPTGYSPEMPTNLVIFHVIRQVAQAGFT